MAPAPPAPRCRACGYPNYGRADACAMCAAPLADPWGLASKPPSPPARREPPIPPALSATDFAAAARANERRTTVLMFAVMGLLWAFGYVLGWVAESLGRIFDDPTLADRLDWLWYVSLWGLIGGVAATVLGGCAILYMLWQSEPILLDLVDARSVTSIEEPRLHNVVEEMAIAAGLPKPKVAVIESPALNAFAFGLKATESTIGVTRGLLETLDRDALQGVVAHEMGHLTNDDVRHATLVAAIAGLIVFVGEIVGRVLSRAGRLGTVRGRGRGGSAVLVLFLILGVFVVLAPLCARLVQMAISRQREFLADATAVRLTRNPAGLVAALQTIAGASLRLDGASRAAQHLFIANPFGDVDDRASALMSTHPPLNRRIERLLSLGREG